MPRERRCLSHPLLAPGSCFCRAASLRMPVRPSRNLPLCPAQPPTVPSETEAEAEEDCPAGVGRFAGTPRPFLTQILLHLSPLSRPPQGLKTQSQPSVTAEGPFPKESALSHECTSPVFLRGQPSDSTRSQLPCSRPTRGFLEQSTRHAYETPSPLCSGSRLTWLEGDSRPIYTCCELNTLAEGQVGGSWGFRGEAGCRPNPLGVSKVGFL